MFIVAALDESIDADVSAYGLGGFIADQTEWNKFEAAWKPTHDRLGSAGKTFHMTDCERGYNDFAGMDYTSESSHYHVVSGFNRISEVTWYTHGYRGFSIQFLISWRGRAIHVLSLLRQHREGLGFNWG